ncbi:MAG: hypothetical protein HYR51_13310 [Candidatus Rokubacteria bacterium]|nr:hypothetical protein [Candidatus Rokubacteria bacterium]
MTPEQIVPLALFVMVVLFNLVGRWLRSRMREQQERQERQRQQAPPAAPRAPLPPRVRIVTRPPAAEERRTPRREPGRVERPRPRRLLGTRADVRRGVVLMAVLGPPRGLQPDGPDSIR